MQKSSLWFQYFIKILQNPIYKSTENLLFAPFLISALGAEMTYHLYNDDCHTLLCDHICTIGLSCKIGPYTVLGTVSSLDQHIFCPPYHNGHKKWTVQLEILLRLVQYNISFCNWKQGHLILNINFWFFNLLKKIFIGVRELHQRCWICYWCPLPTFQKLRCFRPIAEVCWEQSKAMSFSL